MQSVAPTRSQRRVAAPPLLADLQSDATETSTSITTPATPPVEILKRTDSYVVVNKPPSVPCHHSYYVGKRQTTTPMLQRIRDTIGQPINLVHRLDRGASGCLLCTYAATTTSNNNNNNDTNATAEQTDDTAHWSQIMARSDSCKTYLAVVRGEGILHGESLCDRGWFLVDRPIKNEKGIIKGDAQTWLRFVVAGQTGAARASIVLARPVTGRWHQIRRHLNGLSHPILGDGPHGNSKVNREWREQRGLPPERLCLHLCRLQLQGGGEGSRSSMDVACPLAPDILSILEQHLPDVLREARPILAEEGVILPCEDAVGSDK